MSRARNIKPGFFKNDLLADCQPLARLLFAGLWCEADRAGRLEDRPKRIKAECLPYDACDVDALLGELAGHGFILRYTADEHKYIQILAFDKHQNPHCKESASTIPAPCEHSANTEQAGLIPDSLNLIPDPSSQDQKTLSVSATPKPDDVPAEAILAGYRELLPDLPQPRKLDPDRKKKIIARWREDPERQSLEWWRNFWAYVAQSDFLTGRDGKWQSCNLDWLLEPKNMRKVTEGNYENRGNA